MELCYDFHMHSALSPCAENDMTPTNIVNMALLNELDAIALTDHNICKNCPALEVLCKENGIIFIPGMELTTQEEIHIVCLFYDVKAALEFSDFVQSRIMRVKNKPEIFGNQYVMNEKDEVIGEQENLLITACDISVEEVPEIIKDYDAIAYPAHIDRDSYSIISSLGVFPEYIDFNCAEISKKGDIAQLKRDNPILGKKRILQSSDAHRLEDTFFDFQKLNISENSAKGIINVLKSEICE